MDAEKRQWTLDKIESKLEMFRKTGDILYLWKAYSLLEDFLEEAEKLSGHPAESRKEGEI